MLTFNSSYSQRPVRRRKKWNMCIVLSDYQNIHGTFITFMFKSMGLMYCNNNRISNWNTSVRKYVAPLSDKKAETWNMTSLISEWVLCCCTVKILGVMHPFRSSVRSSPCRFIGAAVQAIHRGGLERRWLLVIILIIQGLPVGLVRHYQKAHPFYGLNQCCHWLRLGYWD